MRQGNTLNIVIICMFLAFTYLGSIVLEDALKPNSESNTANALVGQLTCGLVCPTVESRIKALEQTVTALKAKLDTAESALALADDLTECVSVDGNEINGLAGPHVIFQGCNVHVQSGSGATNGTLNGLGNLVVGYNEDTFGVSDRTGSHNLAVGSGHTYSSYGGLVAGLNNTISGDYSTVSGGAANTASGSKSSVSGGVNNTASDEWSSVSGGQFNTASGIRSSVSGGFSNTAIGGRSSVSGGNNRTASGDFDWVAGSLSEDF